MFPYWEGMLVRTLLVAGGTEDGLGVEVVFVAVHWADFRGNECAGGLAAATAVQALKEVQGQCHICQGLLTWNEACPVMWSDREG